MLVHNLSIFDILFLCYALFVYSPSIVNCPLRILSNQFEQQIFCRSFYHPLWLVLAQCGYWGYVWTALAIAISRAAVFMTPNLCAALFERPRIYTVCAFVWVLTAMCVYVMLGVRGCRIVYERATVSVRVTG